MQIQTKLFRIKHFQLNTENNAIRYLLIDVQSFGKLQKKKKQTLSSKSAT